jgi:hypothetical protein
MITAAFLASELALCENIFLEYTNLYLQSHSLSTASEQKIWQGCVELDSAVRFLRAITLEGDVYYCKGVPLTEEWMMSIIYLIHEYEGQGITNNDLRQFVPSVVSTPSVAAAATVLVDAGIREGKHVNMPVGTYRITFSRPFTDKNFNNHVQITQNGFDVFDEVIEPTDDPADLSSFEVTVPAGELATIYYTAIKFQ